MATLSETSSTWLKQHGSAERSFARALRSYFAAQADRVADAWEALPTSPDNLASVFNSDAEHELLKPIVRRNLGRVMILGAEAELEAVGQRTKAAEDFDAMMAAELPPDTRDAILQALDELEQADYWQNIQSETQTNLREIIQAGIDAKQSNSGIALLIRDQLGGYVARRRAMMIARTEVTGAMNAGHLASMESLDSSGLLAGKMWLGISDRDQRQSHADASGQTVQLRASFRVGGYDAPYPGHWSLPAKERVHCRCTILSVLADGLLDN